MTLGCSNAELTLKSHTHLFKLEKRKQGKSDTMVVKEKGGWRMQRCLQLSESFCKKYFRWETSELNVQMAQDWVTCPSSSSWGKMYQGAENWTKQKAGLYLNVTPENYLSKFNTWFSSFGMVQWRKFLLHFWISGGEAISSTSSSSGSWSHFMNSRSTEIALLVLSYSAFSSLPAACFHFSLHPTSCPIYFSWVMSMTGGTRGEKHKRIFHRKIIMCF